MICMIDELCMYDIHSMICVIEYKLVRVVSSPCSECSRKPGLLPQRYPRHCSAGVSGAQLLLGRQVSSWDFCKLDSGKDFCELEKKPLLSEVDSENHGCFGGG